MEGNPVARGTPHQHVATCAYMRSLAMKRISGAVSCGQMGKDALDWRDGETVKGASETITRGQSFTDLRQFGRELMAA